MATSIKWVSDPAHSEILFKVKHMMITNVKGEFRKFRIGVESDGNTFKPETIQVVIEASSVFTNNEDRDNHLRSADFFDADNYNELVFKGKELKLIDGNNYLVKGTLTIKGIEKPVSFSVTFAGIHKDPWGKEKAGFSIEGNINRKDWDLNWNVGLESGGVLVSEEVKFNAEVQLVKMS